MLRYLHFCTFFLSFACGKVSAQLQESFSNGNITQNPVWIGDTSLFFVNTQFQLQSGSTRPNDTFYISTENKMGLETEWEFWVRLAFNTSTVNYADVFLISLEPDLTSASNAGYFVRMGGVADEISLFRRDADNKIVKIIDGEDGVLNTSDNVLRIRVTRDAQHNWRLFRDIKGGHQYFFEGMVMDTSYIKASWFGILVRQSTSSFFQKHFFDDIKIQKYVSDDTPPLIDSIIARSETMLDVYFNEPVDQTHTQTFNFFVNNGIGFPQSAAVNSSNSALVHLTFATSFENRKPYELLVKDIQDITGNSIKEIAAPFIFNIALRYDVVFTEIFSNPNRSAGLPPGKFLEIYNRSVYPVPLGGWQISESNNSAKLPALILQPAEYLVVTSSNSALAYSAYGKVVGIPDFPNLPVNGGRLILKNVNGETMHAVEYSKTMFKNEVKKEGGWSLELIDVDRACDEVGNWSASVDPTGGTPGKKNSIAGKTEQSGIPELRYSYYENGELVVVFNRTVDSASAVRVENFTVDDNRFVRAEAVAPMFKEVRLILESEVRPGKEYELQLRDVAGCATNSRATLAGRFGVLEPVDSGDIVVNEILFNPPPGGVDYVELYNRSGRILNLQELRLANRNSRGELGSLSLVSDETIPFFPGDFILLSVDKLLVQKHYITENKGQFLDMTDFPSYANTGGHVVILNREGVITDEVGYSEKWHHELLKNKSGVALERIDPDGPSTAHNFHSAAATAGYGTPGYKNSQYRNSLSFPGELKVEPEIFSPDSDGRDDFVRIHYNFKESGFVANIKIFDAAGRQVRHLESTSITGTTGYFKWDGLDDGKRPLPQGVYIIYTRIFSTTGKSRVFKNTVVLGRR